MDASFVEILAAAALGFAGGMVGGLIGVGGGVLFVPALALFLDQSQLEAVSTSLLAIVPVAIVGTWRQYRYGNVRVREGVLIGALSPLGVVAGVVLSNNVSERVLELSFAALIVFIAIRLVRRALTAPEPDPGQRSASDG
jgi:hypothetical protein